MSIAAMAARYALRHDPDSALFTDLTDRADALRTRAVALDAAADVPAELGGLAADVAAIGEKLAVAGNPNLRSDACAASLLGRGPHPLFVPSVLGSMENYSCTNTPRIQLGPRRVDGGRIPGRPGTDDDDIAHVGHFTLPFLILAPG
jgi:hypothetical protein